MSDTDDEDRTIAEIRAYQRGRLIRSTPVRRAMTDTPICRHGYYGGCQDCESATGDYAEGDAAVVADSPELAQALRERIAALEAETVQLRAHALGCHGDYDEVVRQRDAALARVRELEAAAQPKPRDESVPPPGWEWVTDRMPGAVGCQNLVMLTAGGRMKTVRESWLRYDAEHGYAPPDEAAIRADERRRTERDIAAELLRLGNDGGCSWCGEQWSEAVGNGDYPRTDAPAPAPAPKCTCAEDLRAAAGMLRRTTRTIDPPTAANCRIAAGYDAAAAWLDSPGVAPAADPEGGA